MAWIARLAPIALLALAPAAGRAAEVVGEWTFDDGQGEVAKDRAGKHDGRVTGAEWTDGLHGKALSFHGPDYTGPAKAPGTFVEITGSEALNPRKTVEVDAAVYPTAN